MEMYIFKGEIGGHDQFLIFPRPEDCAVIANAEPEAKTRLRGSPANLLEQRKLGFGVGVPFGRVRRPHRPD